MKKAIKKGKIKEPKKKYKVTLDNGMILLSDKNIGLNGMQSGLKLKIMGNKFAY